MFHRLLTARRTSIALALAAIPLLSASGICAEQIVLGKKLLIKNPPAGSASNKVVYISKDPTITVGATGSVGDPQCSGADGGGGSLNVLASGGAGGIVEMDLPCGSWTTNSANSLYKYKDPSGATCKLVLVKAGAFVKVVCKGSQVTIDLNGSMSPVDAQVTLNSVTYCAEFGGTVVHDGSDDTTFLRKNAPAVCFGVAAPSTTTTTSPGPPTTTTTLAVAGGCCEESGYCKTFVGGGDQGLCIGTWHPSTICDGTGHCVAPNPTPGNCCQYSSVECRSYDAGSCNAASGSYVDNAVCNGGACFVDGTTVTTSSTTTSTLNIACCQGVFPTAWCTEGTPSSTYQENCASAFATYSSGLRCDGSTGTCGAVRAYGGCCALGPSYNYACVETSNTNANAMSCTNISGSTWSSQSACDISSSACIETVAPCSSSCGGCGSSCGGFGVCTVGGGGTCGHTGSATNVCINIAACTPTSCAHDGDCPSGQVCIEGQSCCSRCP